MRNLIYFFIFLIYTTLIFFIPNTLYVSIFLLFNLFVAVLLRTSIKKMFIYLLKILPFILFTFIINCFLDNLQNATWVAIKLILVCHITYLYSRTISIAKFADTIKLLCSPLKLFKINTDEIKVLVCISLSMIPVLKSEFLELKDACSAKGIQFTLKNTKIILYKFFVSLLGRVNEIDESLNEKGYNF